MQQERVKEITTALIQKMGFSIETIDFVERVGQNFFSIKTKEPNLLIGQKGETLRNINFLVKKILENQNNEQEDFNFTIDVNEYHQEKILKLEEQAKAMAKRAEELKCDVEMNPMNAYERLIVHETLKNMPNIETGSKGDGPLRHVVVSYKE